MEIFTPGTDSGLLLLAGAGLVVTFFAIVRDARMRLRSLTPH